MFRGTYYNGQTSKGYVAYIELAPDGVHISFTDDDLNKVILIWEVQKIHKGHFASGQKITLKYGESPMQYLETDDPDFLALLSSAYPQKQFNAADFEFLRKKGLKGIVAMSIGLIALVLVAYFFVLPPVAEFLAGQMPVEMEVKLGDQMYENIMRSYDVNQRLTKEANEYWRAMHVSSPYVVNITVVREPMANAFALPGGQIIVFDGIIRQMKGYDELAGLLAHEYTHVRLRHNTRMMSRNLAGYLFISLLLNDASGTIAVLATNANSLKELSYSRLLEHQADAGGYDLMHSAHISPDGMLKLFQTLKSSRDQPITVPQFISSHPLTDERIAYINNRLKNENPSDFYEHKDLDSIWQEMKEEN